MHLKLNKLLNSIVPLLFGLSSYIIFVWFTILLSFEHLSISTVVALLQALKSFFVFKVYTNAVPQAVIQCSF